MINIISNGTGPDPDDNNQPEPPGFTPDPPPTVLPGQLRAPLQRTYQLTLRAAPTTLQENEMVTFDGYLTYTTVFSNTPAAAAGKEVTIYQVSETSTGTYNSVLGTAVTDSQDYYYKLVPFETAGYYAVYESGEGQDLASSSQTSVTVEKKTFTPIRKDIIKPLGN